MAHASKTPRNLLIVKGMVSPLGIEPAGVARRAAPRA
jgi:hypothetical protein